MLSFQNTVAQWQWPGISLAEKTLTAQWTYQQKMALERSYIKQFAIMQNF